MNRRAPLATLTLIALLGACASDDSSTISTASGPPGTSTGTSGPATTGPVDQQTDESGGWVGGEPEWMAAASDDSGGDAATAATAGKAPTEGEVSMEALETASAPAGGSGADATSAVPVTAVPPVDGDDVPDSSPLRAGNVDDNADFAAFIDYLVRIDSLGIETRPFDPRGRIVVSVIRPDGLPAAGVEVEVTGTDGAPVATIRSTADGSVRFLPALYGPVQPTYGFAALEVNANAAPDGSVQLTVEPAQASTVPVALDVLFLLDATGSMGDEIDRLKTTIDSVAVRLGGLDPQPDVRFGMTLYRDLDDSFVTSTYDFTADIDGFRSALGKVVAEGGGDYPEALDEGLAEALTTPSWRDPATTVQLVFLIADAPPQIGRQVETTYVQSVTDAISRGIKIIPVASSESDDQAEAVFRQLAQATGARFVFLSNGAAGAATGPATDIESTDYEELALDDLVVRLVSEELAALTATMPTEQTPPTDPPPPPTNPEGQ